MPEERVAAIINGDFYEKNVLEPYDELKGGALTKFDKAHLPSNRSKLREVKKLKDAYEKALRSACTVFGSKNDFEGIIKNINAYYDYKDKEVDETATYNSTLGRIIGKNITEYSGQIKKMMGEAEQQLKAAEEAAKGLKSLSRRKALRSARKAYEKASKKVDLQKNIRKRLKQLAMNQSVATKDSITHFIYNEKKKTGMMASLIKAKELLADLIKEENDKEKISGYRKLNVKDIQKVCKNLEDSSDKKEAFYGNLEKFNKVYEQISEHLLTQKSNSAKGNIPGVINIVNTKIDTFIENNLIKRVATDEQFKTFSKNLKANLNEYRSKLEAAKPEWLKEFPSGARKLGNLYIEIYLSTRSEGIYDMMKTVLEKSETYEKGVRLLMEGSTVLLAACAGISSAGAGFIYAIPFVVIGVAMTTIGATKLIKAKVELNRSENILQETGRGISEQLAKEAAERLRLKAAAKPAPAPAAGYDADDESKSESKSESAPPPPPPPPPEDETATEDGTSLPPPPPLPPTKDNTAAPATAVAKKTDELEKEKKILEKARQECFTDLERLVTAPELKNKALSEAFNKIRNIGNKARQLSESVGKIKGFMDFLTKNANENWLPVAEKTKELLEKVVNELKIKIEYAEKDGTIINDEIKKGQAPEHLEYVEDELKKLKDKIKNQKKKKKRG